MDGNGGILGIRENTAGVQKVAKQKSGICVFPSILTSSGPESHSVVQLKTIPLSFGNGPEHLDASHRLTAPKAHF